MPLFRSKVDHIIPARAPIKLQQPTCINPLNSSSSQSRFWCTSYLCSHIWYVGCLRRCQCWWLLEFNGCSCWYYVVDFTSKQGHHDWLCTIYQSVLASYALCYIYGCSYYFLGKCSTCLPPLNLGSKSCSSLLIICADNGTGRTFGKRKENTRRSNKKKGVVGNGKCLICLPPLMTMWNSNAVHRAGNGYWETFGKHE